MTTLISSQSFIDENIVADKIANEDFEVQISPAFEIDGVEYAVIQDGHHSYRAAIEAGVEPEFIIQTASDNDRIALLADGDIETFLEASYVDCSYYDVSTGAEIW